MLTAAITALLVSVMLSAFLSRYRGRFALLDLPNARSLHSGATPRSGGLAILVGLVTGAILAGPALGLPGPAWSVAALAMVAAVSFADDIRPLPALLRLVVHLAAAILLIYGGSFAPATLHVLPGLEWSAPSWLIQLFAVLFVVWLVNLYNFMDGMDGFAGGMTLIGFGALAVLGLMAGSTVYACAALLVATAAAGFLPFNFPPARLFMGDVGSGSLGFLVALFLLWAERGALFPLWLGVLVFSPFIVDATWTVIRRAALGRKPWAAHREHFYQRLVGQGWSHRRTTLWAYALMLKCSLLAVLAFWSTASGVQGLLLGWTAFLYLSLIAYINALERWAVPKQR